LSETEIKKKMQDVQLGALIDGIHDAVMQLINCTLQNVSHMTI
jgi:hypothetical protein